MSLEHSEVNENNLKKIVVNLGIFGVKHYTNMENIYLVMKMFYNCLIRVRSCMIKKGIVGVPSVVD